MSGDVSYAPDHKGARAQGQQCQRDDAPEADGPARPSAQPLEGSGDTNLRLPTNGAEALFSGGGWQMTSAIGGDGGNAEKHAHEPDRAGASISLASC